MKKWGVLIISFMLVLLMAYRVNASVLTKKGGVNYFNGRKETWYNLDMTNIVKKAKRIGVPGDYWVSDNGLKMYGEFIIVAADFKLHPYGTVVITSHGVGMVLDTGAFAQTNPEQIDIAVAW